VTVREKERRAAVGSEGGVKNSAVAALPAAAARPPEWLSTGSVIPFT
jgi:hypothetical protein